LLFGRRRSRGRRNIRAFHIVGPVWDTRDDTSTDVVNVVAPLLLRATTAHGDLGSDYAERLEGAKDL